MPALCRTAAHTAPAVPPAQKYRMYLKKIGGYSDKDKVDPDALQAIHEVIHPLSHPLAVALTAVVCVCCLMGPDALQGNHEVVDIIW